MTGSILILICEESSPKIQAYIDSLCSKGKKCLVVSSYIDMSMVLTEDHLKCRTLASYLSDDGCREAYQEALRTAETWYQHESLREIFGSETISLGEAVSEEFGKFFLRPIYESIRSIRIMLRTERPVEIIVPNLEDLEYRIAYLVSQQEGIPICAMGISQKKTHYLAKLYFLLKIGRYAIRLFWGKSYNWKAKIRESRLGVEVNKYRMGMFCFTRNELFHSLPLVEKLSSQPDFHVNVVGSLSGNWHTQIKNQRMVSRQSFRLLEGYFPVQKIWEIPRVYRAVKRIKGIIASNQDLEAQFTFDGLPYWQYLAEELSSYITLRLIDSWAFISSVQHSIQVEGFDVVFAASPRCVKGSSVAIGARLSGKLSLNGQHGLIADAYSYRPRGDYMFVWGQASYDTLVAHGVNGRKLLITGPYVYDALVHCKDEQPDLPRCTCSGISQDRPVILLGTSCVPISGIDDHGTLVIQQHSFLRRVLGALSVLSEVQVIIRPHPNENPDLAKSVCRELGLSFSILPEANLWDLLNLSSVVILQGPSTVGLEALLWDKPLIMIDLNNRHADADYVQGGAAIRVCKVDDLVSAIKDILEDRHGICHQMETYRRQVIEKLVFNLDGQAADRAVAKVRELLMSSGSQFC